MAGIAAKLAAFIFLTFAISEIAFAADSQPGTSHGSSQTIMNNVNKQMKEKLSNTLGRTLEFGQNLTIIKVEQSGTKDRHVFDYTVKYEGKKSKRTYKVHCVTDKNYHIHTFTTEVISKVDKKPK